MNVRIALISTVLLLTPIAALAHHSFAMFDHEKKITVSGTLKEFEWTNPHCWLHVNVVDPATGRVTDWAFEMGSIGQVTGAGWKMDSVKPGDRITIEAYPMKDGSHGGQYQGAKLPDGRSFGPTPANPNNPAGR